MRTALMLSTTIAALVLTAPALAQPIAISNPGFETTGLAACAFGQGVTNWSVEIGAAGTWRPGTCWDLPAFEGVQVAYSNNGVVRQNLGVAAVAGATYTLSFAAGARNHPCCTFTSATVQLWANTMVIGSAVITGANAPAPGTWRRYSFTVTAPPVLPANPELIIRFSSAGPQADFDAFTLEGAPGCGSADFDCDGDIGTDADIEAFFACLAGDCPAPPCPSSADFNADGDIGTDADIEAFFRVLAGGTC